METVEIVNTQNAVQEIGSNGRKYLFWRIMSLRFAIPLTQVKEILSLPAVTELPEHHPTLHGVFNLRGKIISVADIRTQLIKDNNYRRTSKTPYVISLDLQNYEIGVIVDDIDEVIFVPDSNIEECTEQKSSGCRKEYIKAAIKHPHNDELIFLLDMDKLLKIQQP